MMFAFFLVLIIWEFQDLFINKYYPLMRIQEATRTAEAVEDQYRKHNPGRFDEYASQIVHTNGIYIRIDEPGTSSVYDGTPNVTKSEEFEKKLASARRQFEEKNQASISFTMTDSSTGSKYLLYITNIQDEHVIGPITLYMITPLNPMKSTVIIMRSLLLYVSAIVMILALLLAIYLSNRLTRPIDNITRSARELTRGNYNVQFDGGNFTETNELAEALSTASYEMGKADFYQREIVANVSHDLKTPLTMIKSYAEMIMDISGDNPEKRNKHLEIIITETDRLNKLVSDMMSQSKLQSNSIELNKEYFDLVELAREAYDSVAVLNQQEGYNIQFRPSKPTIVYGDRDKLSQVIHNFVSNAVKYCGDKKYVCIRLKRSSKKVSLHVIDEGVGIPKDELSHVWERYYRTSANHEREIEGNGIGLSIVRSILALHNANYGVDSEEGRGSDFWFEMPIEKKPVEKKTTDK